MYKPVYIETFSLKLATTPKMHFSKKHPVTELKMLQRSWMEARDHVSDKTELNRQFK